MSGGAFVTIKVGRAGTAGDHARYITRERATEGKQERVWTRNVPEYAAHPDHDERGMSYKERTSDLREYARQLEEDELERPQRGGGEKRTHYRAIYSFDREVTDEKAREMVDAHLAENFPKARTIAAIHRDTDNAHVHVNIAARGTDDKKLHFDQRTHRRLDERWARIYGQEFGRELEREHLEKKQEWRAWMRDARAARARGEEPPPRPQRAARERNQVEERRQMHAKQYGLNHANQTGIRDDQRRATNGEQPATTRGRGAGRTTRSLIRELARDEGAARSTSQQPAAERQQPGRAGRADRTAGQRTQADDRGRTPAERRAGQAGAVPTGDAGKKRAGKPPVYEPGRGDQQPDSPLSAVPERVARAAQDYLVEDHGRDVRERLVSGAFNRVLRLMEIGADADAPGGRDQVAGANRRDAPGASQRDRAADRGQAISKGAARPDRGADHRRERATGDERRADARAVTEQPQVNDEAARRISAGRWRAQYLVKLVQVGLKERETGQNAEAERRELQGVMYYMREAENQHVKSYGGRPRPILMKEERDYIRQNQNAPLYGSTREQIKKDLAQAFVIGETRPSDTLERAPERTQEREKERTLERRR